MRYILGALLAFSIATIALAKSTKTYLDPSWQIDYSTLSLSYYPYIIAYEKITDEEIATLINNLESAKNKNGFFVGISGGWIFNNATKDPNYLSTDYFAYSAKIGYQSFFPSLYDTLIIPNKVGSRIYIQYLGSNAKALDYSRSGFSGIGVSADILVDLPVSKNLNAGLIFGLGALGMVYDSKLDSTLGGLLNLGFDFIITDKHRIEAEIKIIINDNLDWFGAIPMAGYSYVF